MTRFSNRLLSWWQAHGRHDLPWQIQRTPYRVWVSEIMLQQTQVTTVIPYFQRFMTRFPVLADLAQADLDDVLALWSGLGYYARARNLHACARLCVDHHGGELPADAQALQALPGIGPSTAHAILAQAWNQRAPILDGNVKRVLARHAGVEGWPGRSDVLKKLWQEADNRTPPDRAADYTQAIMDLGAGICTPRKPACLLCPVSSDCRARIEDRMDELPGRKPAKSRPHRHTTLLILRDAQGRILLTRRPPSGIWGGLWCLPEHPVSGHSSERPEANADREILTLVHQFTHFSLTLHFMKSTQHYDIVGDDQCRSRWFTLDEALNAGLPRPIRTALERLCGDGADAD